MSPDPTLTDEELAEIAALPTEVERTSRLIAALRAERLTSAGLFRLLSERQAEVERLQAIIHNHAVILEYAAGDVLLADDEKGPIA